MNVPEKVPERGPILGGLWGALVGNALGVPVEFKERAILQVNPVTSMREFGTHDQPHGTWSGEAVNLGYDTDTTGCVAGGLAGVAYGMKFIPADWIRQLARRGELDCLFQEFADLCEATGMKDVP